ncbi:MAG: YlxR family protein [Chloroflexi bacterium]|nr:YlxR family protein [Chloroflexota bacterium]
MIARPARHIPERTCVICREKKAKRELIRLVRTEDGSVEVDTMGRRSGRGAYLCQKQECWRLGLKGKRLDAALKTSISRERRAELERLSHEMFDGSG